MQALELNLATRPFRNNTLLWLGLVLALLVLGAVTTWNVRTYRSHWKLHDDLVQSYGTIEEQLGDLERREDNSQREIKKFDLAFLAARADKANEVIRWKAFSWTRLFNLLQQVQPNDVQMTAVHPVFRPEGTRSDRATIVDPEQVPVSVEGVAKSLPDFFELERQLISDPHFDRVEPERTERDDTTGETVFRIRFLYDPRVGIEAAAVAEAPVEAPAGGAPGGAGGTDPAPQPAEVTNAGVPGQDREIRAEGWDRVAPGGNE